MSNIDSRIKKLEEKLKGSSTAYKAGVKPTKKDVETERELRVAKATKSRKLGEKPKGEKRREPEEKTSTFTRVLNFLNAPVALGAGALESVLGQGTEEGVLENIRANIREGGTYGDVLRQSGVRNTVAAPVGFALDIALDPINWATAGTAAMVPKIGKGLAKKGLTGAKVAAKAAASEKIDNILSMTSKSYRKHQFESTPIPGRVGGVMEKIATNAKDSSKMYDELVEGGSSALQRLTKDQQTNVDKFISKMGKAIDEKKPGTTSWLRKHFWGDGKKWIDDSKLAEDLRNAPDGPPSEKLIKARKEQVALSRFEEMHNEGDMLIKKDIPTQSTDSLTNAAKMTDSLAEEKEIQARMESVIERYFKEGSEEARKLRKMETPDKEDYLATFTSLKADVEGYDKAVAKVLLNGTAQKFFKGHSRLMGFFKASVIGLSVPARVNQAIGNFVAFVPISGINPFNTGFTKSVVRATKFSYTGDLMHLKEMLTQEQFLKMLDEYPETFTKITGIKAEFLSQGTKYLNKRVDQIIAQGGNAEEANKLRIYISKFADDSAKDAVKEAGARELGEKIAKKAKKEAKREAMTPFVTKGTEFDADAGRIGLTQEFNIGQVSKWSKELKAKGEKGDKAAAALHWMITSPLEDYGRGDQIFKLGTMMHLTKNGISESEMKVLQKWYKFKSGDIIQSGKGVRFKLTPEASMEVANELFLNYSAMPSWSKIARSLPMVGAPFASFAAGAQKNVLKGIGYNLSYFNKARNLIHEVSGSKGPMEREALESGYYDNITSNPAMVKLPFFKENPVYLNLGNALHVFDSNLLDSPNRDYESKYGKEFVSLLDKSPFFKDPTGQFILNYMVLPRLLGEAIGPFNNELYSEDASTGEKVGRSAVGLVEPFMPKTPGVGLATLPVPEEGIPYIPSYSARRLRNAALGKGPTGSNSSESKESKTARAVFADMGLPVYRVQSNINPKK